MEKTETMNLVMILEAVLFSSDKPVSIAELNRVLPDKSPEELRSALERLLEDYENMNRSFSLKRVAGGYEFRTKAEYSPYIVDMLRTSPARLSRAAMETLAIIAYKQPILRQEIEVLRGVDVGGILRTLMEKNLIRVMGRKNIPGKPLIYGTTSRFLEVFDLEDIKSLPELKEIKELEAYEDQEDIFRIREKTDREQPDEEAGKTETFGRFQAGQAGRHESGEEPEAGGHESGEEPEAGGHESGEEPEAGGAAGGETCPGDENRRGNRKTGPSETEARTGESTGEQPLRDTGQEKITSAEN